MRVTTRHHLLDVPHQAQATSTGLVLAQVTQAEAMTLVSDSIAVEE